MEVYDILTGCFDGELKIKGAAELKEVIRWKNPPSCLLMIIPLT